MPYVIGCLALIGLVWMPLYFRLKRKGPKAVALVCKGLGTLSAAALAAYGLCFLPAAGGWPYARWVLAGLVVCAAADVLLEIKLKIGGALFFGGHVLYVAAFVSAAPVSLWSVVTLPLAAAGLLVYLWHYREGIPGDLVRWLRIYAFALASLLAACLPPAWLNPASWTLLGAMGGAFFLLSDILLLRNKVEHRYGKARWVSLGIYYTAQVALGASVTLLP